METFSHNFVNLKVNSVPKTTFDHRVHFFIIIFFKLSNSINFYFLLLSTFHPMNLKIRSQRLLSEFIGHKMSREKIIYIINILELPFLRTERGRRKRKKENVSNTTRPLRSTAIYCQAYILEQVSPVISDRHLPPFLI